MKPKTNVFGQRICIKNDCPAWFESDERPELGRFCEAKLDYAGRVPRGDEPHKPVYGRLCNLPTGFEIVRIEE